MTRGIPSILAMSAALAVTATLVAPGAASPHARAEPTGAITVSAAASLTEAFTEIGEKFEKRYPDTDVTFNFDASSALALQIQAGAPVDVFASADEANMDKLVDGGQITAKPVVFANNELAIATKPGNPENIKTLADLTDVGTVALCASEAPCGRYADVTLAEAEVTIPPDRITRGLSAKATLTAVAAGDASAAIVYVTDVNATGSAVESVAIPDDENQDAAYPIASLVDTESPRTAKAFTKYVASRAGQKVLKKYGFIVP